MMNLNKQLEMRHLRLVHTVLAEGTLSASAKALSLSQSALSHQLRKLEDLSGQALFLRQGKRMTPTMAGRRFAASAKSILSDVEELSTDINGLASGKLGRINVSSECYTSYHWLPSSIARFEAEHPDIPVNVQSPVSNSLLTDLEEGHIDLAITLSKASGLFNSTPLFEDELVALVHPSHVLSKSKKLSGNDLQTECLIVYPHGKEKLFAMLFGDSRRRPRRIMEMPLTEGMLEWCAAALGIAVVARWSAHRYIDSGGLIALPLDNPWAKRTWYATTLGQARPSYLDNFIETAKEYSPTASG